MRILNKVIILITIGFLSAVPSSKNEFLAARMNNVCKDLRDDVLLYFVFIDTRTTYPWTEFDILTTIDSIQVAERWIESKAKEAGISLNIKTDYYIGNEFTTINRNLPKANVLESVSDPNYVKGLDALNKWGDFVSKTIGTSLYIAEKDGIPTTKNPGTKERLAAHLRDEYAVESVALMFFVNNYFREDISLAINTMNSNDVEFAIVSYKYPAEIAHYFIKLFGGIDLYRSKERTSSRKVNMANTLFPNDIMQNPAGKNLRELEIGEFTKYMVGWTNELNEKYEPLLSNGLF